MTHTHWTKSRVQWRRVTGATSDAKSLVQWRIVNWWWVALGWWCEGSVARSPTWHRAGGVRPARGRGLEMSCWDIKATVRRRPAPHFITHKACPRARTGDVVLAINRALQLRACVHACVRACARACVRACVYFVLCGEGWRCRAGHKSERASTEAGRHEFRPPRVVLGINRKGRLPRQGRHESLPPRVVLGINRKGRHGRRHALQREPFVLWLCLGHLFREVRILALLIPIRQAGILIRGEAPL